MNVEEARYAFDFLQAATDGLITLRYAPIRFCLLTGQRQPAGRPVGSRNKSTLLFESLLEDKGEELIRKTIELTKNGDMQALRLCLERLYQARRERSLNCLCPSSPSPIKSAP
jgi:hypothetical protein